MAYAWAVVALIAITMSVMSFVARGKAKKRIGELEKLNEAAEAVIEAQLEEIVALAAGDHGLEHGDFHDVLFPSENAD